MDLPETHPVHQEEEEFFPKGAITFFFLFIVFLLMVWFSIYAMLLYRF